LESARRREIDVVLVWRLDRWGGRWRTCWRPWVDQYNYDIQDRDPQAHDPDDNEVAANAHFML